MRLRASLLVEQGNARILIDASTDFRQQALRLGLDRLDAILFTHAHADHCFGLDDVRPLMFKHGPMQCFATPVTWEGLRRVYSYAFQPTGYPGVPRIIPNEIDGDFSILGLDIEPLTVLHGRLPVTAFKIGVFAYVTDCNLIPGETLARLAGLDVLVIDALRIKPHPTHLNLDQALDYVRRLRPRRALLTHISHDIEHAATSKLLPDNVEIAFDGLSVEID
jgi:phosphoribosyl 1,2-cyclic phosphate phosphodiesterase